MQLTRLNADTSWLLEAGGLRLVIDPWLVGVEIDGFRWFNCQSLGQPALPVSSLGRFDAVIVSQPFSDHCHEETLALLDASVPIYAVSAAAVRIRKHFGTSRIVSVIPAFPAPPLVLGGLRLQALPPRSAVDPTHGSLWVQSDEGSLLYAPHGCWPPAVARAALAGTVRPLTVLATSATYGLPFFLGGTVNLGLAAAQRLCVALRADRFVDTHSERKPATGAVRRFARLEFPSAQEVAAAAAPASE
jgi:hypothetical protein